MIVYRVVHKTVTQLLSGSGNEGRWCGNGRKVIYTSSSIALACLENILRRSGSGFSMDFRTIFYKVPDDAILEEVLVNDLDADWRLKSNYSYCQLEGNKWYDKKNSLILKVPSAIIPDEYNYVIKTTSADIKHIKIMDDKPFMPDERLENILLSVDINKLKKLSNQKK